MPSARARRSDPAVMTAINFEPRSRSPVLLWRCRRSRPPRRVDHRPDAQFHLEGERHAGHRVPGRLGAHAEQGLLSPQLRSRHGVPGIRSARRRARLRRDDGARVAARAAARGMLPATSRSTGRRLRRTLALVNNRVKALGLPIEPLKRFKPWALALTLLALEWQSAGFDARARASTSTSTTWPAPRASRSGTRNRRLSDFALR